MIDSVIFLLALLFIKHWYVDFVNQNALEIEHKGTYLNWLGMKHSVKHGMGTTLILFLFTDLIGGALVFGFLDFLFHYHIDWAKSNINKENNLTVDNPRFWRWLGADQLAHSLTYLFIVWALV